MASAAQTSMMEEVLADKSQTEQELTAASSSASSVVMNVRMVHGMMGEIARAFSEVGSHVNEAQQKIVQAAAESDKTLDRASALSSAVDQIASTADLIDRIANETNMLALNAAIEAARAGELGKGFAVVASEVKSLSKQTAQATEGVHKQLATIRQANREVIAVVGVLNENLSGIQTQVDAVSAAVGECNASLGTVTKLVKEAADNVEGIAGTLDRIAAAAHSASKGIREFNASRVATV